MRILTIKLEKGRIIGVLWLLLALILLTVGVFTLPTHLEAKSVSGNLLAAADESQRQAFFASYGWLVSERPVAVAEKEVPTRLEGEALDFEAMQKEAGLSIAPCLGSRIKAYTYSVSDHPTGRGDIFATLWVLNGRAVAGYLSLGQEEGALMHSLSWRGDPIAAGGEVSSSSKEEKPVYTETDYPAD